MAAPRSVSDEKDTGSAEIKSTSQITRMLQAEPPRRLSRCTTLSGNYNPHIPSLNATRFYSNLRVRNGIGILCEELNKIAVDGVAELIPLGGVGPRFLFLRDPKLIAQVFKQEHNLIDDDSAGVQPLVFHPTTIVNLTRKSKEYKELRPAFEKNVFSPIDVFVPKIHKIYEFYKKNDLDKKEVSDVRNLAERFAITVIFHNLIGAEIDDLTEAAKSKLADNVHDLVHEITTPIVTALVIAQNKIRNLTGYEANFTSKIKRVVKESEELLIQAIQKSEETEELVFRTMQEFTKHIKHLKNHKLEKIEDLYKPEILGLIKLLLVGGFETTSKLLLYTIIFISNKKNQPFVDEMLKELSTLGKEPHELTYDDLKELKYTQAFVFEMLRLYPPFSLLKTQAKNSFWLGDIYIPAGTAIISSSYHAHREKSIYENPTEFRPERWLAKFEAEGREKFSIENAPFKDYFFSFGRLRHCPGRRIPFYEAMILALRMITDFGKIETKGVDHDKPLEDSLEFGFTLELREDVKVSATFTPSSRTELVMGLAETKAVETEKKDDVRLTI